MNKAFAKTLHGFNAGNNIKKNYQKYLKSFIPYF